MEIIKNDPREILNKIEQEENATKKIDEKFEYATRQFQRKGGNHRNM